MYRSKRRFVAGSLIHMLFDSYALPRILVGNSRGNVYRVFLDSKIVVVESKDLRVKEKTGTLLRREVETDFIEFELSNISIIFDRIAGELEKPAAKGGLEMSRMVATGRDDWT